MRTAICFVLASLSLVPMAYGQDDATSEIAFTGQYADAADSVRLVALQMRVMATYQEYPDSAFYFAQEAYVLAEKSIVGGDHPDLATAIANLGYFHEARGEREAARPLYVKALEMNRRMYRGDHPLLAQTINNMAYFYYTSGIYAEAETLFVAAHEMKHRLYPGDHPEVAGGLNNLAVFYDQLGRSKEAGKYYEEALAMYQRLFDGDAPELAQILGNVGYFYVTQGRFADGEQMYNNALTMYQRLYHADHESIVTMINNLAYLYEKTGRLPDAERMYQQSLEACRRLYSGDHPVKATAINNLGSYYLSRGMDAEGEAMYVEALEMRRRIYPEGHPDLLVSINNMGYFNTLRGRYDEAEELYDEAGAVLDRISPGDHALRALHYNNLASLLAEQRRWAEAESLYTAALEMKLRVYDRPHPDVALAYNNIGTVMSDQHRRREAAEMFTKALDIFRSLEEDVTLEIAVTLGNLGRMKADSDAFDEGERMLLESLRMKQDLYETGHTERIASERNLAQAYARNNRPKEALSHLGRLLDELGVSLNLSFGFDSESHQLAFMNNVLKPSLDLLTLFCLRNADINEAVPALMLQALMQFKGAVANESARRSAEWSKDRFTLEVRDELTRLRGQDAQLASRPYDEQLRSERKRIQRRADSLDAALRKLDREYEKLRARQEADWRDVQRQLGEDEALIEFAAVPFNSTYEIGADTVRYAAVILRRSSDPVIIVLADEGTIQAYVGGQLHPGKPSYVTDTDLARVLHGVVWKPLDQHLGGVKRIYLIPDGVLHRLSFHALVTGMDVDSPRYLDDIYELHMLTGSRDLLSRSMRFRPNPYRQPGNAVLVGDPMFASVQAKDTPVRTRGEDADVTRGGSWKPLPGTRAEVESIRSLCERRVIPVSMLVGKDAREEKVKELSGNAPRILHIATHGFFFPVPRLPLEELPDNVRQRGGGPQLRIEDNPMLRSGLVLSGANDVWTGGVPPMKGDDGILSALEISRLDFSGTELVTLSACETGLGDITNGEGIFGLQRAFQVAGSSRLLMTLWRVADEPTAQFMQMFYERLLQGTDVDSALSEARREMRNLFPSPYYWAGFVLLEQ